MKKSFILTIAIFAGALLSARAQNISMFTTFDDWTNWNSTGALTFQATNGFDMDGVTVDGIGNATAGATSLGGSLQVSPIVPCNWGTNGPVFDVISANSAVLTALDGPNAAFGSPLPAQTGTMFLDYTLPDHNTNGTFFAIGIFIQYDGVWGAGSQDYKPTDLGPVSTPSGMRENYRATIPYTITGTGTNKLSYFSLGFWVFTDYVGTNSWYIDNLSVAPIPTTIIPALVYPLFNTYDDFNTGWTASSGDLIQADNTWNLNNSTTNGLGNTNAPAATGAASGSLLINWSSVETSFGPVATGPNEQNNPMFLQALAPGCNTNAPATQGAYGNVYMDYSQPDNSGGGNYFEVGMAFSYEANGFNLWSSIFFPSKTTDLHVQDNSGYEVYQATIPYHIQSGSLNGITPYIFVNSNYQPTNGFHVGNISISSAQNPVLTSIGMSGTNAFILGTNGLSGFKYNVLSTTNMALPFTNWTVLSVGNLFNGPTFGITNNASSQSSFYQIKVQ